MPIFEYLKCHVQGVDSLGATSMKIEHFFGKHNQSIILMNLNALNIIFHCLKPCDFYFNILGLRKIWQNIFFYTLGDSFSIFAFDFHSIREVFIIQGTTYKMLYFKEFYDSLNQEWDKILHLGVISYATTKNKSLMA